MLKKVFVVMFMMLLVCELFPVTVGITQIIDHPALNSIARGIMDTVSKFDPSVNFDVQSAQGVFQNTVLIAQKFREDADIIVAISTTSAQSCTNEIKDKPIIFSAVTDPVSAGLVPKWGKNAGNIVGLSDMNPVSTHLSLIKKIFPNAKRIGIIYNPGEANSKELADRSKECAEELGLEIVDITGSTVNEMLTSLNSRIKDIDAAYLFTDNTLASASEMIGNMLIKNRIPAVAGDIDIAKKSSVIGFGFDYYKLGVETGKMVIDILKGMKPSQLETRVLGSDSLTLYVNKGRAKLMGVTIPDDVLKIADIVEE